MVFSRLMHSPYEKAFRSRTVSSEARWDEQSIEPTPSTSCVVFGFGFRATSCAGPPFVKEAEWYVSRP